MNGWLFPLNVTLAIILLMKPMLRNLWCNGWLSVEEMDPFKGNRVSDLWLGGKAFSRTSALCLSEVEIVLPNGTLFSSAERAELPTFLAWKS